MPLLNPLIVHQVVSGDMHDAYVYLTDAERFIYYWGFNEKRQSLKVQMLHSIYIYLRVFSETAVPQPLAAPRQPERCSGTGPAASPSDGNSSYRFPSAWANRSQTFNDQSHHQDEGSFESKLLAAPGGSCEPSVLELIYQIPESMLKLISHTTLLANDLARSSGDSTYQQRVKNLESTICNYKNTYRDLTGTAPCTDRPLFSQLSYHFTTAVHHAAIIYFYQRVRELNSMVLQHYVRDIITNLLELERLKAENNDVSNTLCWPGFIAGTAATSLDLRGQISAWLLRCGQKSGLQTFFKARDALLQLWNEHSKMNADVPWVELLNRKGYILMFT